MCEHYLEVIRQLRAAGIARVHGDAHEAGRLEGDGGPLEHKRTQMSNDCSLNGEDLLSYH